MSFHIYVVEAIAFLDLLAVSLIIPLASNYVRSLGASHIYVGLLGSVYAGFQLLSGPMMGSLSDLKGRKLMLIITLIVCGFAYTIMGMTNSLILILIIRAILGIFKQTQMLTKAIVPDYEKNVQKQSAVYGKMAAISGMGITLGPVIGGHVMEADPYNGFKLLGLCVGFCFIFNAEKLFSASLDCFHIGYDSLNTMFALVLGLVFFLFPDTKFKKKPGHVIPRNIFSAFINSTKQSVMELYKINWNNYWDIFMFKAFIGFAMSVYYSNYALYLNSQYKLSPKYIGYVISFQGVIGAISSYFMGFINSFYIEDKDYSQRNLHVFIMLNTSLIGFVLSVNVYFYTLWLIPLAIANAVGRLVTLEMVLARCRGTHRAALIGASNSVRSLSGVVAPMVSGFVSEVFGVSNVIYVSICSTAVGLFLSYLHRTKRLKVD